MKRIFLVVVAPIVATLIVMSSLGVQTAHAQKENDFAVWGSITVRKHIISGLSASLNGEYRSSRTATDINLWWINPELRFRFNDYFSLEAGYRYARVNREEYFEPAHRWYAGGTLGVGFGPVRLSLRELIEQIHYTDRADYGASNGSLISYLRSRLQVELRLQALPFVPYAEVENFLYIIDYKKGQTAIMRYSLGARIPVGQLHSFTAYYRCEHRPGGNPVNNHILGLGYTLSF